MDDSTINEYIEKSLSKKPIPNKKEDISETVIKRPKYLWLTSIFNFKFIFIIILIALWVYRIKDGFLKGEDKLFIEKEINEVMVDNKMVPVSNVKVVKISEWVYDSMEWDERSKYLVWSSKKVMFIYWDGCRYARAYNNQIEKALEDKMLSYNYQKEIIKVPQQEELLCSKWYCTDDKKECYAFCPSTRLRYVCWANLCIINPIAKEIVVDESQNYEQIPILLKSYLDWNNKSLF